MPSSDAKYSVALMRGTAGAPGATGAAGAAGASALGAGALSSRDKPVNSTNANAIAATAIAVTAAHCRGVNDLRLRTDASSLEQLAEPDERVE